MENTEMTNQPNLAVESQQAENTVNNNVDSQAEADLKEITRLYGCGKITFNEAKEYAHLVNNRRLEKQAAVKAEPQKAASSLNNSDEISTIIEFVKSKNSDIDEQQLSELSKYLENFEQKAVDKYLSSQNKDTPSVNDSAKSRLVSSAQGLSSPLGKSEKIFTRADIKAMSNSDFLKYEKIIEKQMIEGKIK